jgi:hypothetical protein
MAKKYLLIFRLSYRAAAKIWSAVAFSWPNWGDSIAIALQSQQFIQVLGAIVVGQILFKAQKSLFSLGHRVSTWAIANPVT